MSERLSFEHQLIYDTIGADLYHELGCKLGGLQISFKKTNRSSVLYFYDKGMSYKEIAYKMGVSEIFVRNVIKEHIENHKQKVADLFDN